ncbi:MAG: DUF1540 domain-containing protein, partial [Acetanaerobacterium sp.]
MIEDKTEYLDQNTQAHIDGINCDVTNCIYNQQSQYCTAAHIKVGPNFAATKSDTACA